MSSNINIDSEMQPTTLQEALNVIKFLNTSSRQEIAKWKAAYQKQADIVKKLQLNRKTELEFLSNELQKYESNLAIRTETVTRQLQDKDDIIKSQSETIEELTKKINILATEKNIPEITVLNIDSDSGVAFEMDDSDIKNQIENSTKSDVKTRKCSRRLAQSISFLRRVDFSPRKYKCGREGKQDEVEEIKKNRLDIPFAVCKRALSRQLSNERSVSDDDRSISAEPVLLEERVDAIILRPKKLSDSMNNHFSDDGSEDTSEEVFDRVMTRSSVRRSVKANPKYKKINRTKSKLLEQVKTNIAN